MKHRVLMYTTMLLGMGIILLLVNLVAYGSFTGLTVQTAVPNQDVEGYGNDFSLVIDNVEVKDRQVKVDYSITGFIGNNFVTKVKISLLGGNKEIASSDLELAVPASGSTKYSTIISMPEGVFPDSVQIKADGVGTQRISNYELDSENSVLTGSVVGEQKSKLVGIFVLFFLLLIAAFYFMHRRHFRNHARMISDKHDSNLINLSR